MRDSLKDRVALVTGAVGGIGRAVAVHLAQEGATLGLHYFVEPDDVAQAFLTEFNQQGFRAKLYKADVSKFDDATQLVERVIKDFGRIDILVNNAGITMDRTLKNMTPDQWEKVIAVDLSSVFYCSKAVIGQMLERGYGRIIGISSVVGQKEISDRPTMLRPRPRSSGSPRPSRLKPQRRGSPSMRWPRDS